MTPYADLHIHTTASDGTMTVPEVAAVASEAGISAVAITDHDRIHGDLDNPVNEVNGVTVIRGIELRVEPESLDERIDLLGYGVTETDALTEELERVQRDREVRGAAIVDRVEDHLGVDLDIEPDKSTGRPDIARAINDHPDIDHDYEGAFEHVIGRDCPCYISRDVTDFETGVELLTDACALVGLAHPFRYDNPEAALDLCQHLDAVEKYYPYGSQERGTYGNARAERENLQAAVESYDLTITGGTDAHELTLGRAGLSREEYRDFLQAAGLSTA